MNEQPDILRRLQAENESHRTFCGEIYRALGTDESERKKWPSMIRALRDDAERYRWVVEHAVIYAADFKHKGTDPASTKQPLDNAIDAARSKA